MFFENALKLNYIVIMFIIIQTDIFVYGSAACKEYYAFRKQQGSNRFNKKKKNV